MTAQWPGCEDGSRDGPDLTGPAIRVRRDGRGFSVYLPDQAARGAHGMAWEPEPWVGFTMRGERDSSMNCYGGVLWGPVWSPPLGPDTLAELAEAKAAVEDGNDAMVKLGRMSVELERLRAENAELRQKATTCELGMLAALCHGLDKPTADRLGQRMRDLVFGPGNGGDG